jgi:hypothetical protein
MIIIHNDEAPELDDDDKLFIIIEITGDDLNTNKNEFDSEYLNYVGYQERDSSQSHVQYKAFVQGTNSSQAQDQDTDSSLESVLLTGQCSQ